MIDLSDSALLMIEPTNPVTHPVQDVWTYRALGLMVRGLKEGKRWRGCHGCICGARSESFELITGQGRITNSLFVHYIECHREEVPDMELVKLYAEYMNWDPDKARAEWNADGQRRVVIEPPPKPFDPIGNMTKGIDRAIYGHVMTELKKGPDGSLTKPD